MSATSVTASSAFGGKEIRFVNKVDDELCCAICLNVPDEPAQCGSKSSCAAVFCSSCLLQAKPKKCPVCSVAMRPSAAINKSLLIKNIILKQEIYCLYSTAEAKAVAQGSRKKRNVDEMAGASCEWTGKYSELDSHLKNDCFCALVTCPLGCGRGQIPTRELDAHRQQCDWRIVSCPHCNVETTKRGQPEHLLTCESFPLQCVLGCGASHVRRDTAAHGIVCPHVLVECPFSVHGCDTMMRRCDCDAHLAEAASAARHNVLLLKSLNVMNGKVNDLEAEVKKLKDSESERQATMKNLLNSRGIGPVRISGATGSSAARINQIFDPTPELLNGGCVYKGRDGETILQYTSLKLWTVTTIATKGTELGYATLAAADPSKPVEQAKGTWQALVGKEWVAQLSIKATKFA